MLVPRLAPYRFFIADKAFRDPLLYPFLGTAVLLVTYHGTDDSLAIVGQLSEVRECQVDTRQERLGLSHQRQDRFDAQWLAGLGWFARHDRGLGSARRRS